MASQRRLYLDWAATTPLAPAAFEAMRRWLTDEFGNPSSLYGEGRRARQAIDSAREIVAAELGCLFGEVTFTSSGTEAMNAAIIGLAMAHLHGARRRIVISAAEHHCATATAPTLERLGYEVKWVDVDATGRVRLDALAQIVNETTLCVVAMSVNNEIGTLQPTQAIGAIARASGAFSICDAVQSLGSQPIDVDAWGVDMLAVSAHKVRGPKGIGALYVRGGIKPTPLIVGGGQEREARAGTENVAGIVGFAAAIEAYRRDQQRNERKAAARDRFWDAIASTSAARFTAAKEKVAPGHCHVRFPGVDAESALIRLDQRGVAASSGAACSSGSLEPSHVAMACGWTESEAKEALRFTFGWDSTLDEAEAAAAIVLEVVHDLLELNSAPGAVR